MRATLALLTLLVGVTTSRALSQPAVGMHGAVATVDRIASQAGIDAMKNGGNAVDAAGSFLSWLEVVVIEG